MRELNYHPENYLPGVHSVDGRVAVEATALAQEKRRWIPMPVTPENAYARWNSFRRINDELQPWVGQRRQQLLEQQAEMQRELRHEKVLGSREYGFCLYPESDLRDFLQRTTSQEDEKML